MAPMGSQNSTLIGTVTMGKVSRTPITGIVVPMERLSAGQAFLFLHGRRIAEKEDDDERSSRSDVAVCRTS